MNSRKILRWLTSLRVQMIVFIMLICVILSCVFIRVTFSHHREEEYLLQEKLLELSEGFAKKIIRTGYLTNSSQTELSSELNMAADLYDGRILVVSSELMILMDSFERDEEKVLISEEVVKAINGKERQYVYEYERTTELVSQICTEETGEIMGAVIFIYSVADHIGIQDNLVRRMLFLGTMSLVIILLVIIVATAKMVFPIRKFALDLKRLKDGESGEKVEAKGNSEVRELAESLNEMLEDMQGTEKRRQEFVANVSHELKTPLTSMKILADSLVNQENVPEELYQEFLTDITKEIDRETKIITDLLNLVRLDRKEGEMNLAQVSINELIEIVMRRLRPLALQKNVEMIFESYRPVLAEVDEVKMSLVFTNLIENAIKYNKEDGKIKVSLNADHRYFFVRVEDSGVGIPDEARKYIFDRFYRVDKARSRETGGTGLGLAIAKGAVMMHHGNIKVSGKEGEGTVFVVRIPLNFVPDIKNS